MTGLPEPAPRKRGWFVVFAWVALVLLGFFTLWVTIVAVRLPEIRKAQMEKSGWGR